MKTIQELTNKLEELGHKIYREPWHLNIVFIRNNRIFTNKFDDDVFWFWWNDKGELGFKQAKCTTKAGLPYVKAPMEKLGTGIAKEGQYIDSYKLGLHQGKYEALIQAKEITIWRDNDKDNLVESKTEDTGFFGVNIHRASKDKESSIVNGWSAACLVFANPIMYNAFIRAAKQQLVLSKRTLFSPTIILNNN